MNTWSRRQCLGALGAAVLLPAAHAQAPAHQRSAWPRGEATPALQTLDLQGQAVRLSDFKGRAVLLNFWASWCEPCRAEMPTLQGLPPLMGEDRLAVIALNFKEPPQRVQRFMAQTSLSLPVWLDPQGDHARAWGVRVFPTTVLIARDGLARERVRGEVDWSSSEALGWVERLMAA
ncbi:MAG: TlpA family protein disulfide reductase [Hydrogenophaga sp.]|uniref:TlpA family protein disulfide reductase n=1 Tax=Hydrogenophaga sp. TaxID=1904254 RepID=UPI003D0FE807